MAFVFENPNPARQLTGDCVIRAISIATGKSWDDVFVELMVHAFMLKDIPSTNYVWASYLRDNGFVRAVIPNTCPDCYTVDDFCKDHPKGTYILGTGSHVICVKDGDAYDTWDSLMEVPIYFWMKEV